MSRYNDISMSPIIIAEAGVNHNGSIERAIRMIDAAVEAGADYVKFQTFNAGSLVTSSAEAASYQKNNCNADSQLDMLRSLELSYADFRCLSDYCISKKIGFLSTPFDTESIDFLSTLHMDFMKIPSGEITDLPYLQKVADTGFPVILSTGMSSLGEIEAALKVFYDADYDEDNIILLHCNTEYPTPMCDVNLKAMATMREALGLPVGYSDHTRGIEVALAATALGACVIEKHFTLSRDLPGPDHAASLEPDELKEMVEKIHNVAEALGSPLKKVTDSEMKNRAVARRSIVASRDIMAGEILSEENIATKRPGTGISPMRWFEAIGRRAARSFRKDELIEW